MKNAKQMFTTTVLGIALISVVSCKGEGKEKVDVVEQEVVAVEEVQQPAPKFKDASVGSTFQHYIHLKTALVNSDAEEAKSGAEMIAKTTSSDNAEIIKLATAISAESDIAKQREQFSELTTLLKPVLVANISSGEIYEQHCPMALNGGANWFALEKEVNNPYYGDKMLHCGTVQNTVK